MRRSLNMEDRSLLNDEKDTESTGFLWKTSCRKIDPRMFLFCAQLTITLMVLLFAMSKLFVSDRCEEQMLYGNMVITIVGLWMPSPLSSGKPKRE